MKTRSIWASALLLALCPLPVFAAADQAVPAGMVTFFTDNACPAGWQEAPYAQGRLLLFTAGKDLVAKTSGTPMPAATPPLHPFDSSAFVIALKDKWFVGFNGCSNPAGESGAYEWPFQCEGSTGDLPYIHYRACEKQPEPRPVQADPLPYGTYGFFHRMDGQCPEGWVLERAADGRFAMPLVAGGEVGRTVAASFAEDRQVAARHSHSLTLVPNLPQKGLALIPGFNRKGIADPENPYNPTVGAGRHIALPFVRLLACRKDVFVEDRKSDRIPVGMTLFLGAKECVDGWQRVPASGGRFVVASPAGASSGQTFGGGPLRNGEDREHSHTCQVQIHLRSQNICLNGGSVAVAAPFRGERTLQTSSAPAGVPYLQLSHCQWGGG